MKLIFPTPHSQFNLDRYIRFITGCKMTSYPLTVMETHHILPKCLGGDDDFENLISLPAEYHFVAHWMLWKAYRTTRGLSYAFSLMATTNKNHSGRTRKINSKTYALLKKDKSVSQSNVNRDRWNDPVWATKMRKILSEAASTPKEKARRSANATKTNTAYKEKRSLEHAAKWKDPVWAANTRQRMKDKWQTDPNWAIQHKKKLLDLNATKRTPITVDDMRYESFNAAAKAFDISAPAVKYRVASPNFPNWNCSGPTL